MVDSNILEVRISASSDDAEESASGTMYLTSSDLELVDDPTFNGTAQQVGLRFTGLSIPQGAVITSAYLLFQVDEADSGPSALLIRGHDSDDAGTFTSAAGNISGRATTSAEVAWSPQPWTATGAAGPEQQTPNLSAVIQEIVDRSGWQQGNDLAFIITGSGERTAESFDGSAGAAPLLHVEYTIPGGDPTNQPPVALDDSVVTDEDTPSAPIPVLDNDQDPDGDPLTIIGFTNGANGTVVDNGDGTLTYTADPDSNGSDSFSYTVSDGRGGFDTASVAVTVNPVNDAPQAASDQATTNQGQQIRVYVLANDSDPEGNPLSVTGFTDGTNGTVSDNGDGTLIYSPDPTFSGQDVFSYTVSDGNGELGNANVTVTIGQVPADRVSFAAIGDFGDDSPGELAVANLIASLNVDLIITAGDNSYDAMPIDDNIGQYFSDFIGNYSGTYGPGSSVNRFFPALGNHDWDDGGGLQAYLDYFTLPGNERYYDYVLGPVHFFALDSDPQEPDGRTFDSVQGQWLQQALATSITPWQVVYLHEPPYSSGELHGSDPVMQWPLEDWGADAVIAGHDHVFERIVRDDNGDGTELPYFVTGLGGRSVRGFSDSEIVDGSQTRFSDDYGALLVEADPSSLTFRFYSVENGGTLVETYVIGGSLTVDDTAETVRNTASAPIPVLSNDAGGLTIIGHSTGAHGTVVDNGDGTLTYVPDIGFVGDDSFSYTVQSGSGEFDSGIVSVTVQPGSDPGLTVLDVRVSASSDDAEESASGAMYLSSSDLELVDDPTFNGTGQQVGLRVTGLDIPQGAVIASAYLLFQVDEADSGSSSLVIRGHDSDDAGTFTSVAGNISGRATTSAEVAWSPQPWTATGAAGPAQQTPDLSAVIQEIVDRSGWQQGNDLAFIITGSGERTAESFDGSASAAPLLHVEYTVPGGGPTNQPPVALDDSVVTDEDTPSAPIPVLDNDQDPDGDPLTIIGFTDGANGTVVDNGDGTLTYTADPDFNGSDSFAYTVSDGNGGVDTASVNVTVNPGGDPGLTILDVRVSASSDDAEESASGVMYLNSSDLELVDDPTFNGTDQQVGMRFTGLGIPQGAVISSAYLLFQVDEADGGPSSLVIRGHDSDDAGTFTSAAGDISGRAATSAEVAWSPQPWTATGAAGPSQQTPDLSAVIQEIVDRSGWQQGNDLAFIITGSGERTAESFDGSAGAAPLLHVEYSLPSQSQSAQAQVSAFGGSGEVVVGTEQSNWLASSDGIGKTEGPGGAYDLAGLAGDEALTGGAGELLALAEDGGFGTTTEYGSGEGDVLSLNDLLDAPSDAVAESVEGGVTADVVPDLGSSDSTGTTTSAVLLGPELTLSELEDALSNEIVAF